MNRICILSHAQFLPRGEWEEVMWGNPREGRLGVLAKSLELAIKKKDSIYLCSGIPKNGGREFSPDSRVFIAEHFLELPAFRHLGEEPNQADVRQTLEWLLASVICFDETAQNTAEEVANAAKFLEGRDFTEVISVTAPKHSMRALQEMLVSKLWGNFEGVEICAIPSDVDFSDATAADVSILERAHRHDMPGVADRLDLVGKNFITLMKGDAVRFQDFMLNLEELFGEYGV